jgi:hypothetical protein
MLGLVPPRTWWIRGARNSNLVHPRRDTGLGSIPGQGGRGKTGFSAGPWTTLQQRLQARGGLRQILWLRQQNGGDPVDLDMQGEALALGIAVIDQPDAGDGGLPDMTLAEGMDAGLHLPSPQALEQAGLVTGAKGDSA